MLTTNGSKLNRPQSEAGSHEVVRREGEESVFVMASRFHANAGRCRIRRVEIDYAPMSEVARACAAIFGTVDREDAVQRGAARDAWLLKATLMLTALSFDDPRLGLTRIIRKLEQMGDEVPGIEGPVSALGSIVGALLSEAQNPKRQRLLELLQSPTEASGRIALLANLCGSPTPGWPAELDSQADFLSHRSSLVRTRKNVRSACFSRVLVPGNPWFAPRGLILDLLYGGRTSEVVVLSYRAERAVVPRPVGMPKDSFFKSRHAAAGTGPDAEGSSAYVQIDQWAHDSFWESVRALHGDVTPLSDRDVTVPARFVLFADGSGAFLPEDGRVVEIADRLDRGIALEVGEERLPRKAVRDLEEDDLVMMRLSGSGDYLDDVADSMMAQAGETELRDQALKWKDKLHDAIKRHGEGVVARRLRELGVPLRSAQYLWAWAGESVMAPQDLKTFRALIAAVWQPDAASADDAADAGTYADARWQEMERVKTYHHRAGLEIRAALLTRVRALIDERKRVETVQSIELPGVEAGRMGLLRVSAIDGKSMPVPMSKLFRLEKVRAA
jgi:hypothetical protein